MEIVDFDQVEIDGNTYSLDEAKTKFPDKKIEIEYNEILQIIEFLKNISDVTEAKTEFDRAYQMFKYIVESTNYDISIYEERKTIAPVELQFREIYWCLCNNRSICTGNSYALGQLLKATGIESKIVYLSSDGNYGHCAVRAKLDGKEFICDPTLAKDLIQNGGQKISPNIFAFDPEMYLKYICKGRTITREISVFDLFTLYACVEEIYGRDIIKELKEKIAKEKPLE